MSITAMKQALEALTYIHTETSQDEDELIHHAIASLRQAIAEAKKQEPVAQHNVCIECRNADSWGLPDKPICRECVSNSKWQPLNESSANPVYTHPQPKREWVGLTDDEIKQGCKESWVTLQAWQSAIWWAEDKLKEKNT